MVCLRLQVESSSRLLDRRCKAVPENIADTDPATSFEVSQHGIFKMWDYPGVHPKKLRGISNMPCGYGPFDKSHNLNS